MNGSRKQILKIAGLFITLCVLIDLPDIIFYFRYSEINNLILAILLLTSLLLIPIFFFRTKLRLYSTIIGITALFSPIALFTIIYFNVRINQDMISLILNTNRHEAWELMKGYVGLILLIFSLYIVFIAIFIQSTPKRISRKVSKGTLFVGVGLLFLVCSLKYLTIPHKRDFKFAMSAYYPMYLGLALHEYDKKTTSLKRHPELVKHFKFNAVQSDTLKRRRVYIYIIGESSRYKQWQINGYPRKTSPLLLRRKNLLSFKNVCAAGGLTYLAIPLVVTGTSAAHLSDCIRKKSIVSLFKEAGYTTYWITDQTDNGNIGMYANEADTVISMQSFYMATRMVHHDMELVDTMHSILNRTTNDVFIVIHTLGSHFNYTYRYPKAFDRFQPSGWHKNIRPSDYALKPELINGYDNTILYSDAVIDSAINIMNGLKNTISFLLFASDHGENLYDEDNKSILHTSNSPTKYIAHIPLFIYTNSEYRTIYPKKITELIKHSTDEISSTTIFYTLADMANIRFDQQDSTRSLASNAFIEVRAMILGGDSKLYYYDDLK